MPKFSSYEEVNSASNDDLLLIDQVPIESDSVKTITVSNLLENIPGATITTLGTIILDGDLGGTAVNPLIKRTDRFIVAPYGDTRPADYTCAGPSNNEVEINQAIIAANALPRGANVELLDGYFEVSNKILRLPNVHIYGQGIGHTKVGVVAGGNRNIFDMDKVTYDPDNPLQNSIIADMEISGENMSPSSECKAINGGNFKYCKIMRVWAHDTTATGIGDDDFYGTTIDQCIVTDCGYENKRNIIGASYSSNSFTFETSTAHGYTAWARASATLTASGTPSDSDTVTIDGVVYTYKITLTGTSFEVLIGGSAANALTNLKSAINLTGTIGVDYGLGTTKHPTCAGGTLTSSTLLVTSNDYGTSGNSITVSESGSNTSWSTGTLVGGVSGNKIVVAGFAPSLYNGLYNVTSVTDSTHFVVGLANNGALLNLTVDPGTPTTYGNSSDSLIGHNGIGIASGSLTGESCIVTNSVCIGNQNNNFLIEADNNNSRGQESYIFSNCISINAGQCGFRNTGSLNAQFNNCYDYGSPTGGLAGAVTSSRVITGASWSGGIATFETALSYLFSVGSKVQVTEMVPTTYNGYYTVLSTPTSTSFTVSIAADPGAAVRFGNTTFDVHPVDGSSFNDFVSCNNLNYGLLLPSEGVIASNPVIKDSYNYGIRATAGYLRLDNIRVSGSGRDGVSLVGSSGSYRNIDHTHISGFSYNNGKRFAGNDGIAVTPASTVAIKNLTIDVHAFDDQDTKTQRYGVLLSSGGTMTNIHIRGNLTGNLTAPILTQNTSDSIYLSDVVGVNPNGKSNLGNVTGSTTFNVSTANLFIATLTGNITAVMTTPPVSGTRMVWVLTQDGTGSRTLTLPVNASTGATLTLSTAAGAIDVLTWIYDGVGGKWRLVSKNLNSGSVGTLQNLVVTTPNSGNVTSLAVTQNDTTNSPITGDITNAGTNFGLRITQTGVLATNKYSLFVDTNAAQTTSPLARFRQQNASSTTATVQLDNAGSGPALHMTSGGLRIGSSATGGYVLTADSSGNATYQPVAASSAAPATAGSTGTAGAIAYDSGFIYVCIATNTWKRVAIATW